MIKFIELMFSIQKENKPVKYYEKQIRITAAENKEEELANILTRIGYKLLWMGEYRKSMDYHTRSLELFEKLNNINGIIISLIGISQGNNFLSDFKQVDLINERLFDIINRSEDIFAKVLVWLNIAEYEIMRGNLQNAENYASKVLALSSKYKLWYPYSLSKIILGYLYLLNGAIEKSLEFLEQALSLIEENNLRVQFNLYIYYLLPEVYMVDFFLKEKNLSDSQRGQYLQKIRRRCEEALRVTKKWKTHYGGALRVKARYYALAGKNKTADKMFLQSIEHCAKLGRRYELAITFLLYSAFLRKTGREKESLEKLKSSYRVFKEIGSRIFLKLTANMLGIDNEKISEEKISQSQAISFLISESQEISSVQDLDILLDLVIKKAAEITGADMGFISIFDDKSNMELLKSYGIHADKIEKEIKPSILEIFKNKEVSEKKFKEFQNHLYNDKEKNFFTNTLCFPINSGGNIIGLCLLEKSSPEDRFTDNNAKILRDFLSHVSLSIENAFLRNKIKSSANKQYSSQPISKNMEDKIKKAISYIEENYMYDISKEGLAASLDINSDNLGRFFKKYTRKKISEYINYLRIKEAAKIIKGTEKNITEIAYSVGFDSISTFNRAFQKEMETTPTDYRQKHRS